MNYPTIKLQFDQKLDQDMAWFFYNNQKFGGCDFWKGRALKHHPLLDNIESSGNKKKYLNNYIDEYYLTHAKEIKLLSNKIKEYLEEQEKYFIAVDKIFKGYPWPKNKIIGYFSIFDFCPRFLKDAKFQTFIYDNRNVQLFVTYHECLHFIFYDFAQKKFPETLGKMNTEEGKFWALAEVFNIVIQTTDDFINLHGKIENIGYPDHKELIKQGSLLWNKNPNVSDWIVEMMQII